MGILKMSSIKMKLCSRWGVKFDKINLWLLNYYKHNVYSKGNVMIDFIKQQGFDCKVGRCHK